MCEFAYRWLQSSSALSGFRDFRFLSRGAVCWLRHVVLFLHALWWPCSKWQVRFHQNHQTNRYAPPEWTNETRHGSRFSNSKASCCALQKPAGSFELNWSRMSLMFTTCKARRDKSLSTKNQANLDRDMGKTRCWTCLLWMVAQKRHGSDGEYLWPWEQEPAKQLF